MSDLTAQENRQALIIANRVMNAVKSGKYDDFMGSMYVTVWAPKGTGRWERFEVLIWIAGYHVRPVTDDSGLLRRTYVLEPINAAVGDRRQP